MSGRHPTWLCTFRGGRVRKISQPQSGVVQVRAAAASLDAAVRMYVLVRDGIAAYCRYRSLGLELAGAWMDAEADLLYTYNTPTYAARSMSSQ